jgi:hypothetical protein
MSTISPKIINGGSKLDMFQQLLDYGRVHNGPLFDLELAYPAMPRLVNGSFKVGVRIQSIEVESGDGNCWNLIGTIVEVPTALPVWAQEQIFELKRFKCFYQTDRRTGHLTLV